MPPPPTSKLKLFDSEALHIKLGDQPGIEAHTLKLYRSVLYDANQLLREYFQNDAPITELVHGRAALIDELLVHAWSHIWPHPSPPGIALIAVGGYGRAELHPCSDIDLLILLADTPSGEVDPNTHLQQSIEKFVTFLWDIGLEVGHSVRSVSECTRLAEQDITIATNLMEARLLAGPDILFQALRDSVGVEHIWPTRQFFEAKCREQIQRHHKYNDTAYNLEPNVKEGPGGLRDIQMIGWVAKRHFGADTLHDLVTHNFLTEQEYEALIAGQNFLWQVRFALHILTNRREDRLLFDYQRTLAERFGYLDDGPRMAVEQFMKRYYRTIMELNRLNEMLLQHFQEAIIYADQSLEIMPINKRFQARGNFIEAVHEHVFKRYPFALLEVFLLLAERPELKGVRASTIRLIRDHRYLIDDKFRADLRCRTLFMELLRQPNGITHELRRMNSYGVLGAYLPVFGNIVGQMQHDLFHVYTVDEHTLFLVRNLRRFALPEFADEFPLCSEVFQRLPKAEILYLAGLFHDIAKGRGGDHSELGAEDALNFCLHHGLSPYDAQLVSWLVKNHLIMSSTAQRQDISDPEVIMAFAALMRDQIHLNYLYLLTVADIRATNTTLWNSWKASLLADLYLSTLRALRRGLENPLAQAERVREHRAEARRLLQHKPLNEVALTQLWQELGDDYFLRYSAAEITWHSAAILAAEPADLPLILIRQNPQHGGTEVFIYARDQDYLFAVTTGALAQMGLTVVDARIITANSGYTLNTYSILEESGQAIDSAYRMNEIFRTLKQQLDQPETYALRQTRSAADLLKGPVSRRAQRQISNFPIATQVNFTLDERNQRTIVEVISNDRPGLLSAVGQAFMDCGARLQNAKIATFGARAEDIFFVTDSQNRPITDDASQTQLRVRILNYLGQPS
ncbi:MAG: [protein-PII] uridylyltransferase [Gammaproteobacteria bacterium]